MKTGRIIAISTLVTGVVCIGVILMMLKREIPVSTDPRIAVSPDAALILETSNLPHLVAQLQNNNLVWHELEQLTGFDVTVSWLSTMDSLFKNNDFLSSWFNNRRVILSFEGTARLQVNILLAVSLLEEDKAEAAERQFLVAFDPKSISKTGSSGGDNVYRVSLGTSREPMTFFFCLANGVMVFGNSTLEIDDAVARLKKSKSFSMPEGYARVSATAGANVAANIYVQSAHLPELVQCINKATDIQKLSFIKTYAGWSEYDLSLGSDMLVLNGFSSPGDSLNTFSSVFANQKPAEIRAIEIIPQGIKGFIDMGISNFRDYYTRYSNYLSGKGQGTAFMKNFSAARDTLGVDLVRQFAEILDGEAGMMFLGDRPGDETVNFLRIRSQQFAVQLLQQMLVNGYGKLHLSAGTHQDEIRIKGDSTYQAYELPVPYLNKTLFGPVFGYSEDRWCTITGNYLLFATRESTLHRVLDSIAAGQILKHDIQYHAVSGYMDNRSNFTWYHDAHAAPGYFDEFFYTDSLVGKGKSDNTRGNLQSVVYQFSHANGLVYNNFFIRHMPVQEASDMRLWRRKLEAPVSGKPYLVMNHNTRTSEIMVQDTENHLYLLSSGGVILWEIPLKEKILSGIAQVDFFRNGKLQYLFNTENAIYLVDRRGKFTGNFPVKIKAKATNGMLVADYEGNRDYRYILAVNGNRLIALDRTGTLLKGWKAENTDCPVTQPVQYFRIEGKDYLVATDNRKLYLMNRKGENLLKGGLDVHPSHNPVFLQQNDENYRFVFTDSVGTLYFLKPDGTYEQKSLKPFTAAHYFDYQDIDGDGRSDYIFLDGHTLGVYRSDGSAWFNYSFTGKITNPPVFCFLSNTDREIGVYTDSEKKAYLINSAGSLHPGFPVAGTSPFAAGNLGEGNTYNLLIGGKENFLCNFIVQYMMTK